MDGDLMARIGYLTLLLIAVGGWAFAEFRGRMGQALRMATAWGMIVLGLVAGYGIWNDISQNLRPRAAVTAQGTISIPRAPDGHYYLTVTVNDVDIDFLIDTGATNVVLNDRDARRIGIDPATLAFSATAQTANGPVQISHVTLDRVAIGPYADSRVSAWVSQGETEISLLGMSYLSRYDLQISGGTMTLSR